MPQRISPVAELRRIVNLYPKRADAAKALGISPAYITDLLHDRRDFSDQMLARIGLKRKSHIVRLTPKEGR